MPIVSVVIPNYNHALFLKQRINSVLEQSFVNFEVIILDDCSTDNSKELIEKYRGHPRISHIAYNVINSGSTFKQWKKGIELAKGKYIWFAESDDHADPQFLERMIPLFDSGMNIGLVFCNSHIIDTNGKIIDNTNNWGQVYVSEQANERKTYFNGYKFCTDHLLLLSRIPNASAVLFTKELVTKNLNWIDERLINSGDWKLWIHISLHSNIVWLNEELNYFRKHANNVTNTVSLLKHEALYILKEVLHQKININKYRLFESIFFWSFNTTAWSQDTKYNLLNLGHYFDNNISASSLYYYFIFLLKRFILYLKIKLRVKRRSTTIALENL